MTKRICFLDVEPLVAVKIEDPIDQLLYEKLEKNTANDTAAEIIFHQSNSSHFQKSAVAASLKLKENYPEKDIQIIAVVDPMIFEITCEIVPQKKYPLTIVKTSTITVSTLEKRFSIYGVARSKIDKINLAPAVPEDTITTTTHIRSHERNYNLRVYEHCTDLIAYYYDALPNTSKKAYAIIKNAKKRNPKLHVDHLYSEKLQKIIDSIIPELSEREQYICRELTEGKTQKEIADSLGISGSRVHDIIVSTDRRIREKIYNIL